jgi:hypothetical protein
VLKDLSPKCLCWFDRNRRMNRCSTVGSSGAEAPVLARLCLDSNEASDRPTVSSLRPLYHPVLLALLLLLCNSSGASRNWTIGSFARDVFILAFCAAYQLHRRLHRRFFLCTVGSSYGALFLLFLLRLQLDIAST